MNKDKEIILLGDLNIDMLNYKADIDLNKINRKKR